MNIIGYTVKIIKFVIAFELKIAFWRQWILAQFPTVRIWPFSLLGLKPMKKAKFCIFCYIIHQFWLIWPYRGRKLFQIGNSVLAILLGLSWEGIFIKICYIQNRNCQINFFLRDKCLGTTIFKLFSFDNLISIRHTYGQFGDQRFSS